MRSQDEIRVAAETSTDAQTGAAARVWEAVTMGTLGGQEIARCNPGAVAVTMMLGMCIGPATSTMVTIGSHVLEAVSHPDVAAPVLGLALYFSTLGGLLISSAAGAGATIALAVTYRWWSSRLAQAAVAGIGASLAVLALMAFRGPAIIIDAGAVVGILACVAASAFGLICIRARAHTSGLTRPEEGRS